jgi:hypothetical protein
LKDGESAKNRRKTVGLPDPAALAGTERTNEGFETSPIFGDRLTDCNISLKINLPVLILVSIWFVAAFFG